MSEVYIRYPTQRTARKERTLTWARGFLQGILFCLTFASAGLLLWAALHGGKA